MRDFLFIVTYGRSGSTLLQGVLNSIEGYSITGENMMAFYDLYKFHTKYWNSISSFHANIMPKDCRNSWYQTQDIPVLKETCRQVFDTMLSVNHKDKVLGFKEIRWKQLNDLENFLDWLFMITNCRFIYLTRDLDETCISKWHKENPDCHKQLNDFEKRMESYIARHPYQKWFHLDVGTLHNVELEDVALKFKDLYEWLGEEFDIRVVKAVCVKKHSY